ncbi:TPA: hypothetical protein O3H02_004258 [Salmonella enterica subsp. enterica serovar Saintpaul str. CFSAN004144]|nr:hypothetical protein [Salmonella enterica subsp. enterica serovar Saintpaul str. CFSAN004144]
MPASIANLFRIKQEPKLIGDKIEERAVKISSKKIGSCIMNTVKRMQQARGHDERTVCLSLAINQEIDKIYENNKCYSNKYVQEVVRQAVFDDFSRHFGIPLDALCAQSTINQMISENDYFRKKIDKFCQGMDEKERNNTEHNIINELADRFYQKNIQNIDLDQFRVDVTEVVSSEFRIRSRSIWR